MKVWDEMDKEAAHIGHNKLAFFIVNLLDLQFKFKITTSKTVIYEVWRNCNLLALFPTNSYEIGGEKMQKFCLVKSSWAAVV